MVIRVPKFGNKFTVDARALIQRSVGGDLIAFHPSDHPTIEGFQVEFEALTDDQMWTMVSFFDSAAGEVIAMEDHEGTLWEGIIKDENITFTENGKCKWELGFSFEGIRTGHAV